MGLHKATTAGCDCYECQIIGGGKEVSLSLSHSSLFLILLSCSARRCDDRIARMHWFSLFVLLWVLIMERPTAIPGRATATSTAERRCNLIDQYIVMKRTGRLSQNV